MDTTRSELPAILNPLVRWEEPLPADQSSDGFILPLGTVTLLLADIEGSVRLWESDREAMAAAVARLNELVDDAVGRHEGVRPVEQGEGDSFVAAFARASDALACAVELQRAIAREAAPLRVRMALHTGEAQRRDQANYVGRSVNRCARLRELAHGGQTLLSRATHDLVADALPEDVLLIDLGVHRLRDLARAEHVWQAGSETFPPLRSLDTFRHNLPVQLTSFVGRADELRQVAALLEASRLVTLTGIGGCGKTRLALQVAADAADAYPDGVWFCDLGPVTTPSLVASTVASTLGLADDPQRAATETVAAYLGDKRALVVLDNCEHLVADCAALTDSLLRRCPSITLLATSREALGVEGEAVWIVPPLSIPSGDEPHPIDVLTTYDAVRLFVERAVRARPNFSVTNANAPAVAHLCRRLDGIPLAIELAAAMVRVLTVEQVAAGVDDRFDKLGAGPRISLPRQQTLSASIDWSHNLLTEPERTLFRRLAVFADSFDLDAAEGVGIDPYAVLALLSSLVDKSLVLVDDEGPAARYRMLETVRRYARDRLAESADEIAARTKHRDHYVALAAAAWDPLNGPDEAMWLDRLETERPNLRRAVTWTLSGDDPVSKVRVVTLASALWTRRGPLAEVRLWFDQIRAFGAPAESGMGAWPLLMDGLVLFNTGDAVAAERSLGSGLPLATELGDTGAVQLALYFLSWCASSRGDTERAAELNRQMSTVVAAASPATEHMDPMEAMARGMQLQGEGKLDEARVAYADGVAAARRSRNRMGLQWSILAVGQVDLSQGDLRGAQRHFEDGLAVADEARDAFGQSMSQSNLAWVRALQGDVDDARRYLDRGFDVARESGVPYYEWDLLFSRGIVHRAVGELGRARADLQQAVDATRTSPFAQFIAGYLTPLGEVARLEGDVDAARGIFDEVVQMAPAGQAEVWKPAALRGLGLIARTEGDLERAEALVHESLAMARDRGMLLEVVDDLEALAWIAADLESYREAARLFGAAQSLRDTTGYARFESIADDVAAAREHLDDFDAFWAEGAAMSLDEAVAYAARGRGERKRPSAGWASLTPTELDVVRLVRDGLSNPQIAERLFVSRNTVQTHIAHVFAKLGMSSRAELAAEAVRRGL